ncbi:MAG: pro-sigmaK processing inhibitor BofA family protein [Bacillota bacterium]|nr:pro-sigmaK processing inhibitor BofA family protein [Bacillota bacterium]
MVSDILAIAIAVMALWLFFKIFSKSFKFIFRLLINSLVGFFILFVVNYLGGFVGLHINVGWISALITGVLGIPGIVLLLLIENMIL